MSDSDEEFDMELLAAAIEPRKDIQTHEQSPKQEPIKETQTLESPKQKSIKGTDQDFSSDSSELDIDMGLLQAAIEPRHSLELIKPDPPK